MARERADGRGRWWLWLVAAAFWPAAALGQGADQLASTIEQSLASIAFRLEMRPGQAGEDLAALKRQLDLLEQQTPDHPALPALKEEHESLEARLEASAERAAEAAPTGSAPNQTPTAPDGFTVGLEEVDALQKQAETAFLLDRPGEAKGYLDQAEQQMAEIEERYRGQVPRGLAPVIVTRAKLEALRDQIAETAPAD